MPALAVGEQVGPAGPAVEPVDLPVLRAAHVPPEVDHHRVAGLEGAGGHRLLAERDLGARPHGPIHHVQLHGLAEAGGDQDGAAARRDVEQPGRAGLEQLLGPLPEPLRDRGDAGLQEVGAARDGGHAGDPGGRRGRGGSRRLRGEECDGEGEDLHGVGSLVAGWVMASEICHRRSAVSPSRAAREGAFSLQEEKYLPLTPWSDGDVATWMVVLAPLSGEARNGCAEGDELAEEAGVVPPEPAGDGAGVEGVRGDLALAEAAGQLPREEDVGQLRLGVGLPHPVSSLPLQVVEVDRPALVRHRGDVHDPRPGRLPEERQELEGELEVGQVVQRQRHLHPVGREPPLGEDGAGVVDEQVEPPGPVVDVSGQAADLLAGGEVGDQDLGGGARGVPDLPGGGRAPARVAGDDQGSRPHPGEFPGGHPPDPVRRAGDERHPAVHRPLHSTSTGPPGHGTVRPGR